MSEAGRWVVDKDGKRRLVAKTKNPEPGVRVPRADPQPAPAEPAKPTTKPKEKSR